MNKTGIMLFILLLSLEGSPSFAQVDDFDHLTLGPSALSVNSRYYDSIREILFDGVSESLVLHFLTTPSFGSERLLGVVFLQKDSLSGSEEAQSVANQGLIGKKDYVYNIILHKSEGSIWYNYHQKNRAEKPKVYKLSKPIDESSMRLMHKLYQAAIMNTRYGHSMGLDGVSYYFSDMIHTGKTWSPEPGTKMGRLVEINEEIINLVKGDLNVVSFDENLQNRIRALINDFE